MRRADHNVDLLSPLYGHVDTVKLALARRLTKLEFELGGKAWSCELYTGRNPDGVDLTFIGNEEVLLSADSLSGEGGQLEASRVGVFAKAATELIVQNADSYDVVHAHGSAAGAVVARLRSELPDLPTVFTVYDASEQGRFDAADADWLGLGDEAIDEAGVTALKAGLLTADQVTALSPNYAHRLQRPDSDDPLSEVFRKIGSKLTGVRHGIDPAFWNPATDGHFLAPSGTWMTKAWPCSPKLGLTFCVTTCSWSCNWRATASSSPFTKSFGTNGPTAFRSRPATMKRSGTR
jgi:glycogen synthase